MDWYKYIAIGVPAGGAIGTLAWKIVEWRLRRARIKINISEGHCQKEGRLILGAIIIKIVNLGEEPIRIASVGFKCKNNQVYPVYPDTNYTPGVYGEELPYILEGRDSYEINIQREALLPAPAPVKIPLVVWCKDAVGKTYYSKKYKIELKDTL